MQVPRLLFLMIFGSESECLGLENQAFGIRSIAKNNFHKSWISHKSESILNAFECLGSVFMILAALESGLKLDDFSTCFWGHARA